MSTDERCAIEPLSSRARYTAAPMPAPPTERSRSVHPASGDQLGSSMSGLSAVPARERLR